MADGFCLDGDQAVKIAPGTLALTADSDSPQELNRYLPPATEIPPGKSVFVASSRLGQKLEQFDRWFDALRTLAVRLDPTRHFFITAAGTTTDRFVRRISQLYSIKLIELSSEALNQKSSDETLIRIADEVHLLSVRKNGKVHAAVQARLVHQFPLETNLLIDPTLTPKSVTEELIASGVIGWWLYEQESPTSAAGPDAAPVRMQNRMAPILELNEIQHDRFLLHWTRRRVGPWPNQANDEYLDDLIFQTHRRQHGELSSLARILACQAILATSELTRDNLPVVCFSNCSLMELPERTIFRQHLGRWDFLPFGIAIDREALIARGARPVIYGDETDWENMAPADRPFFQISKSANGQIDWTAEQEWRLLANVKLNHLPLGAVIVFVKTVADAEMIAGLSRWPIVVVGQGSVKNA